MDNIKQVLNVYNAELEAVKAQLSKASGINAGVLKEKLQAINSGIIAINRIKALNIHDTQKHLFSSVVLEKKERNKILHSNFY